MPLPLLIRIFCLSIIVVMLTSVVHAADPSPLLRIGRVLTPAEAKVELDQFCSTYADLAGWEQRRQTIREGILHGAGLSPVPEKTPLLAQFSNPRTYDGYTVQSVAFQSSPGFYVTGSLYMPTDYEGDLAGVLCPHGRGAAKYRSPSVISEST